LIAHTEGTHVIGNKLVWDVYLVCMVCTAVSP
jgi:hypothetical protein